MMINVDMDQFVMNVFICIINGVLQHDTLELLAMVRNKIWCCLQLLSDNWYIEHDTTNNVSIMALKYLLFPLYKRREKVRHFQ